jgi:hypothetical protein
MKREMKVSLISSFVVCAVLLMKSLVVSAHAKEKMVIVMFMLQE